MSGGPRFGLVSDGWGGRYKFWWFCDHKTGASDQARRSPAEAGVRQGGDVHAKTLSTPGKDGKQGAGICGGGNLRGGFGGWGEGASYDTRGQKAKERRFLRNEMGAGVRWLTELCMDFSDCLLSFFPAAFRLLSRCDLNVP